jgi:flagellar biosynthesis chaperone FliJ
MPPFRFGLESVLEIRTGALRDAESATAHAREVRDAAKAEYDACREREDAQMIRLGEYRDRLFESGGQALTGAAVQGRVNRLDIFVRDLELTRDQVFAQSAILQGRESELRKAVAAHTEAKREVEILEKYRERAKDRFDRQTQKKEDAELDEIGSIIFDASRQGLA